MCRKMVGDISNCQIFEIVNGQREAKIKILELALIRIIPEKVFQIQT